MGATAQNGQGDEAVDDRNPPPGGAAVDERSPRQTRLSGPERQRSIVEAATEVFAKRGFEGARIEEIAEAAGVSKALIYEHFSGKRELYAQIMRAGTEESLKRTLEATAGAEGSVEIMQRALGAFLDFVAEDPNRWRVIEQEVSDPEIMALDQGQQRQSERAIAALLAHDEYVVARKDVDPKHLEMLGVMIQGATVRAANWWIEDQSMSRDEVLLLLMRFMWLGLERIRRNGPDRSEAKPAGQARPAGGSAGAA
jgi:AcrR family transcriptional regulator